MKGHLDNIFKYADAEIYKKWMIDVSVIKYADKVMHYMVGIHTSIC